MNAYEIGIKLALGEVGLTKEALIAEGIGALASPKGEGWRGASGAGLGASLGGLAGVLGGGALGGGLGAGIGGVVGGGDSAASGFSTGGRLGAILGGLGGSVYGGVKGYQAAILDEKAKQELLKEMLDTEKLETLVAAGSKTASVPRGVIPSAFIAGGLSGGLVGGGVGSALGAGVGAISPEDGSVGRGALKGLGIGAGALGAGAAATGATAMTSRGVNRPLAILAMLAGGYLGHKVTE